MGERTTEIFNFESREAFEQAEKEADIIGKLMERTDFSDSKIAFNVYNKLVSEKHFNTVTGYFFLLELRKKILESKIVAEDVLAPIPIKEPEVKKNDAMPRTFSQEGKYRKLYEGQQLLNKKLKITIAVLIIAILGFVFINFKFEYTIFTYFTDYKTNMEEELINKYQYWEEQLKARESKLGQETGQSSKGEE